MLIEVFRAGSPAAIAAGITAADLADVASFDCANNPVPSVIGHPTNDTPAHGAIRSFRVEGDRLLADVPHDLPAFQPIVSGIKSGTILTRSMAFFGKRHPSNPTPGKIAPKHLGFLGGAAPGIAGMKPLAQSFAFSADELEVTGEAADAVVFDAAPEPATGVVTVTDPAPAPAAPPSPPAPPAVQEEKPTMTAEEIAEKERTLAERERAADEREKQFAADAKAAREAGNATTVDQLITAGKVLPADKADLVAAFNAVDGGDVIAFASDAAKPKASPVSIIASIMAKGGKVTPAGDPPMTPNDAPEFAATGDRADELAAARKARLDKYGK